MKPDATTPRREWWAIFIFSCFMGLVMGSFAFIMMVQDTSLGWSIVIGLIVGLFVGRLVYIDPDD